MRPADRISMAIRSARDSGRPALVAFLTAGFPDQQSFARHLDTVLRLADVVEIGVPFTDPLADGVTIQKSSEVALKNGVTLNWILEILAQHAADQPTPALLMSYLNPLLAMGYENLAERCAGSGVAGLIVPDLPYEESTPLRSALDLHGLALVQLVSPVTAPDRMQQLCKASSGFVYAVTVTGVTGGGRHHDEQPVYDYLDRVRGQSPVPVCAGFGIRTAAQVEAYGRHADGVIVGSALVEVLQRGESLESFLQQLRGEAQ